MNNILKAIAEGRPTSPHTSNNNSEGNEEYKQRRIQNRKIFREKRKIAAEKRKTTAANKAASNLTALFSRSQFLLGNPVKKTNSSQRKPVKTTTRKQPLRQSTRTRVKPTQNCKSPSKKEPESSLQKYNRLHKLFSTFNNAKKQSLSYNQKCYLENSYNKFKTKRSNKPSYANINNSNMAGPSCAQRYSSMSE